MKRFGIARPTGNPVAMRRSVREHDRVTVEIASAPLQVTVRRDGRRLIGPIAVRVRDGEIEDQFIQLTEGVHRPRDARRPARARPPRRSHGPRAGSRRPRAALPRRRAIGAARRLRLARPSRTAAHRARRPPRDCTSIRPAAPSTSAPTAATPGPTARPTCSTSAASRRATTRRCRGCCPRAAGPPGWRPTGRARSSTLGDEIEISARAAAGPLRLHLFCQPTPTARLRAFLRTARALPAVLPEWAYGHWKSRDVYEHQRDVEADFQGYLDTSCRSTRSCSTRRGRRNTTPGSSTRTSSPMRPG